MLHVIKKTYESNVADESKRLFALDYVSEALANFRRTPDAKGLTRYINRCITEIKNLKDLIYIGEADDMTLITLDALIEKFEERKRSPSTIEEYIADLQQSIIKLSADDLKRQIKRQGVLYTTAPVLPITADPFEVSVLKEQKIKYSNFANYIVLTEQKVLAFTKEHRARAQKLIKHIKGVRKVTDRPYVSEGITWYWLSDNLDGLVLASKTFNIQSWSPFLRS